MSVYDRSHRERRRCPCDDDPTELGVARPECPIHDREPETACTFCGGAHDLMVCSRRKGEW